VVMTRSKFEDLPVELIHDIFHRSSLTSIMTIASTNRVFRTLSSLYLQSVFTYSFTNRSSYLVVNLDRNNYFLLPSPQLIKGECIISSDVEAVPFCIHGLTLVVEIKDITLIFVCELPFLTLAAQTDSLMDFMELSSSIGIPNVFKRIYLKITFAVMGQNTVLEEVSFGFDTIVDI
jgi:hypothetical protein